MRLTCSFLAVVLAFAVPVFAKQAQPRSALFTQAELSRLTEQEQERYFEALRDFMEAQQEPSPSFAQYFLDAMLGKLPAFAQDNSYDTLCDQQIYRNGSNAGFSELNPARNSNCYAKFLNIAKSGSLGTCEFSVATGDPYLLICRKDGKTTTYQINSPESNAGSRRSLEQAAEGSVIANRQREAQRQLDATTPSYQDAAASAQSISSQAQPASGATPSSRGGGLVGAGTNQRGGSRSASPPSRPSSPRAADAANETARCAYAGFLISRKGGTSCAYITDLCAANLRIRPESSISSMQKAIGCPDNPGMKCGTGTAGTAAARNKVACNPLLYGYKGEGADKKKWKAICVAPGKNASANCRSAMDEQAKKNIKDLIKSADGKKAFEDTTKEINNVCKRHWKLSNGNEEITEAAADTTHDNDRREDKNRGDFQKTCLTLLNRVREIARDASAPAAGGSSTTAPVPQSGPAGSR